MVELKFFFCPKCKFYHQLKCPKVKMKKKEWTDVPFFHEFSRLVSGLHFKNIFLNFNNFFYFFRTYRWGSLWLHDEFYVFFFLRDIRPYVGVKYCKYCQYCRQINLILKHSSFQIRRKYFVLFLEFSLLISPTPVFAPCIGPKYLSIVSNIKCHLSLVQRPTSKMCHRITSIFVVDT